MSQKGIKSIFIIQKICRLSFSYFIYFQLQKNILERLDEDFKLMERWEPTIIIGQVFPYHLLKLHVNMVTLGMIFVSILMNILHGTRKNNLKTDGWLLRVVQKFFGYVFMLGILFGCVLLTFILCGASPFEHLSHTLLASWYFTILTFGYYIPPKKNVIVHVLMGEQDNLVQQGREKEVNDEMKMMTIDVESRGARIIMYTTLIVTIPFQILHILDHGDQIQRWPIPIILGATMGHICGCVIELILGLYYWFSLRRTKKAN